MKAALFWYLLLYAKALTVEAELAVALMAHSLFVREIHRAEAAVTAAVHLTGLRVSVLVSGRDGGSCL